MNDGLHISFCRGGFKSSFTIVINNVIIMISRLLTQDKNDLLGSLVGSSEIQPYPEVCLSCVLQSSEI